MITIEGVDPKMIANNLKPYKPTYPDEVLKDELEFRGIHGETENYSPHCCGIIRAIV